MKKVMYFDCETGGLDPKVNSLIDIACIIEIDGKVVDKIELQMNQRKKLTQDALDINGHTRKGIKGFPNSDVQFKKFLTFIEKHVDRYNKADKLRPIGYNATFDIGFLQQWFFDNDNKWYGAYFNHKFLDPFQIIKYMTAAGLLHTENEKLGTICKHYGIKIDAHNAMSDIKATRKLHKKLMKGVKRGYK